MIREMGLQGMITLRADLAKAAKAIKKVTGLAMPAPRMITTGQGVQLAWMSPDEVMILCDHASADGLVADLGAALASQHHLVVNVSDARAMFALSGQAGALRDVIAKIPPADIHGVGLGRDAAHADAAGGGRDLVRDRDRGAGDLFPLGRALCVRFAGGLCPAGWRCRLSLRGRALGFFGPRRGSRG